MTGLPRRGAEDAGAKAIMNLAALLERHPEWRRGARDMADFIPGIAAWGLVTGVAMVKGGLSVPLALFMSLTVYSGAAQLATLPLIVAGAPLWVVWGAAACVNLRFVIYSAQWRVYFGHLPRLQRLALTYFAADINLVGFQRAYPQARREPGQVPYYVGGMLSIWLAWQIPACIGIFLADTIPVQWGLGFAGTLAMLGLTYGLLSDRSTWTAAAVAGLAAVAAFGLPLKLNIVVAIAAAVAAGLLVEQAELAARRLRGANG
jgi:predicted branched-subunit amino acid permease